MGKEKKTQSRRVRLVGPDAFFNAYTLYKQNEKKKKSNLKRADSSVGGPTK